MSERKKVKLKWVGLIAQNIYTPQEQEQIRKGLENYDSYPVFVDEKTLKNFMNYYDYVITPVFHNFVSYKANSSVGEQEQLQAYRVMNQAFVDVVMSLYKKDTKSLILFNDPYFLLAPKLITELAQAHIGYFMHSPFPSYEIFRIIPLSLEVNSTKSI